ncbi:MAG TPA: hypothetical protein VJ851_14785 [Jatrophihabitans sp.]|nr:hypothetical protein [Jatrophihabitans sp.]
MSSTSRSRPAGAILGAVSLAALALTSLTTAATAGAASNEANPYSPAYNHPYRHGVLPTIGTLQKMRSYAAAHPSVAAATGPQTLSYGGGIDGIGVTSGKNKTYLVFFGTQWGTSSTDANGNLKFSNDSAGAAGAAQQMFKGIGTNNELWSADLTQWCDGAGVSAGATSCPSGAARIPYMTGGVLAGVWYDNSKASPSVASKGDLGREAVSAAAHFGNTTAASNRYAYYVIMSPHGTNPDNYQGSYCAWHDWNGDVGVTSFYGDIAFSNQPYNIDSGAGCGVGFVNSPGTTDGYTITLGHEWHETMSDQNPAGGWTNHTGSSYNGEENSDECAWIYPGQPGGAANVSFGSFGTYAEQASWSNDTNNCAISHEIVGGDTTKDAWFIKTKNTNSGKIEVHNATAGSFYTKATVHAASWISTVDQNNGWFQIAGYNQTPGDLWFIKTKNTSSGQVEVHNATAASGYTKATVHAVTWISTVDQNNGWFQMVGNDLWFIKTKNTSSGQVEVHNATAASGYTKATMHAATWISTADQGNGWFQMVGKDLWFIKTKNTSSGQVEVHNATAESGFTQATMHAATWISTADQSNGWFQMVGTDLWFIKTRNTSSGQVELHNATAASAYLKATVHSPSWISTADQDNGWFQLGVRG